MIGAGICISNSFEGIIVKTLKTYLIIEMSTKDIMKCMIIRAHAMQTGKISRLES